MTGAAVNQVIITFILDYWAKSGQACAHPVYCELLCHSVPIQRRIAILP